MGTRSSTIVIETGHKVEFVLVNIYRQFDGYPSGHGKELAEFITPIKMVNGIVPGSEQRTANGAGCFAAQLIAHLKTGPGHIYIDRPVNECEHDYTYKIRINTYKPSTGIHLEVWDRKQKVFSGSPDEFSAFCTEKVEA